MTLRKHTRNDLLRALLAEARWTNHNFSLAVNRVAAEAGIRLHYDRTSVSHWLSGTRPRPPVPTFAAEALSRRLGRPVYATDTGMADPAAEEVDSAFSTRDSGFAALHRLLKSDLEPRQRTALREQPFRVTWASAPRWCERPDRLRPRPALDGGHQSGLLAALTAMTSAFAAADRAFGGGHARLALAAYLETETVGLARSTTAECTRGQLISTTAGLTGLIGFMCFDDLHHHLAQRYHRVALLLADEAGDRTGHALVLRDMSTQACFLGHYRRAARLAEAAVDRIGTSQRLGTRAVLSGQAAVAHAAMSDRKTALARLAAAERYLDKADDLRQPNGDTDHADLKHLTGQALASLHDYRYAENALRESLRYRPEAERRARLLTTHQLAELQLRQGDAEQACATWQRFLDECSWVRSGRVHSALHTFRRRLHPHRDYSVVHQTLGRTERLTEHTADPLRWVSGSSPSTTTLSSRR
ncbi:hypothetical protein [Amycolatopsis sp. NPDC051102]|uniref:hypothetical protein n=1 Tax=Amycolatopsis sp. NPDC051102 TaxID=3155163 RepID=UPI00342B21D2